MLLVEKAQVSNGGASIMITFPADALDVVARTMGKKSERKAPGELFHQPFAAAHSEHRLDGRCLGRHLCQLRGLPDGCGGLQPRRGGDLRQECLGR